MTRTMRIVAVVLIASLGWAMDASAITTKLDNSNAIYQRSTNPFGIDLEGVAFLTLDRTDGVFKCSAALLPTRRHLLTAGHCITGVTGSPTWTGTAALLDEATAEFKVETSPGVYVTQSFTGTEYFLHPLWDPASSSWSTSVDLAVIQLSSTVGSDVTAYSLYRDPDVTKFSEVVIAGYGRRGTGATGVVSDSLCSPFSLCVDQIRVAKNTIDADWGGTGKPWAYDFDDGIAAHDSFGLIGQVYAHTGLGDYEGMIASGDSGGPSFLAGQIVGVHSFTSSPMPYDAVAGNNSSFGDAFGDANVPMWAAWVDSVTVPLPGSLLLVLSALGALTIARKLRA